MEAEEEGKREEHRLEDEIATVVSGQMTQEMAELLGTQNSSESSSMDSGAQSDYEEEADPTVQPKRMERRLSTYTANPFEIQGMTELRTVLLEPGSEAAGAFNRVVHPRANLEVVRGVVEAGGRERAKDPIDSLHPVLEAPVQTGQMEKVELSLHERPPEIQEEVDVYDSLPTPPQASTTVLPRAGKEEGAGREEVADEAAGGAGALPEGAAPLEVRHDGPPAEAPKKRNIFKRMFGKRKRAAGEPKDRQ